QVNPEIQAEISTPQGPVKLNIKKTGEKTQVNAESKKRIKVVILLENGEIVQLMTETKKRVQSVTK
ncbi:MAG: hypothetical protein N2115_04355, partial [bacterium]|nr:hypothetical protein [bacterium]